MRAAGLKESASHGKSGMRRAYRRLVRELTPITPSDRHAFAIASRPIVYTDASKPGGYDVKFIRDSYPSMGAYMDGPNGFTTMKEDRERAWNLYEAFLRLFGAFKSISESVRPPAIEKELAAKVVEPS